MSRIRDEKLTYHLVKAMRHSLDFDGIGYYCDVTIDLVSNYVRELFHPNPFKGQLEQEAKKESKKVGKEARNIEENLEKDDQVKMQT